MDDDSKQHRFELNTVPVIEAAYEQGKQSIIIQSGCHSYEIDLKSVKQKNTRSGTKRTVVHCKSSDVPTEGALHIV